MSDVEKRLVLRIDPEPAKRDAGEIKQSVKELTNEAGKLKSSFDSLSKNTNFSKLKEQMSGVNAGFKGLSTKANNTAKAFEKLQQSSTFSDSLLSSTESTNSALDGMRRSVLGANESLNELRKEKNRTTRATRDLNDSQKVMNQGFQNSAKAVQLALGPLSGVAARITATATLFRNNTAAIAGFVGAVTGIAVATSRAVRAGMEFERQMLSLGSAIRVTGRESSTTAEELNSLAESIAEATLSGTNETRRAISILLTYQNIAVETFEEITIAAQGIASTLGMGLTQATRMVARALEEPTRSMESLRRIGVSFTDQQRLSIRAMEDMGMTAAAQSLILNELAVFQQTAKDEAEGLAGQIDTYGERVQRLFESVATGAQTNDVFISSMETVNNVLNDFLNDSSKMEPLIKAVEITVKSLANTFAFLANNIEAVSTVFASLLAATVTASIVKFTGFTLAVTGLGNSFLFASAGAKAFGAAVLTFAPIIAGLAAAAGMLYLTFMDTGSVIEDLSSSMETIGRNFESFDNVIKKNTDSLGFMNDEGVRALEISFRGLNNELDSFSETMSGRGFSRNAVREISSSIADNLENAELLRSTVDEFNGLHYIQIPAIAGSVIEDMIEGISEGSEEALETFNQFKSAFEGMGEQPEFIKQIEDWLELKNRIGEAGEQLEYFRETSRGATTTLEQMDVTRLMDRIMTDTSRGLTSLADLQDKFATKFAEEVLLGDPEEASKRVRAYFESYRSQMEENLNLIEDLSEETRKAMLSMIDDTVEENVRRVLNPSISEETLSKMLNDASKAAETFNRELKTLVMTSEEYAEFQRQESIERLIEGFGLTEAAAAKTNEGLITVLEQMARIEGLSSAITPLIEGVSSGLLDQASAAEIAANAARQHAEANGLFGKSQRDLERINEQNKRQEQDLMRSRESLIAQYDEVFAVQVRYRDDVKRINELIEDQALKEQMLAKAHKNREDALKALNKPQEDYWKSLEATIENLEFEIYLIGKTEEEVNKLTSARELQLTVENKRAQALAAGIVLEGEDLELLEKKITRIIELNNLRDEQLSKDILEKQAKEELLAVTESLTDSIMDGLEAAMEGMESFRDFFNNMLRQLALDAVRNKIVVPIVQGGIGEGTSGSIGDVVGGFIGGNENLSAMSNTQMLVSGGIGYGAASMMGGTGEHSGIGSAAGTILGGAAGGPVGAAVGSFIGSVVGGLFSQSKTVERSVELSLEGLVAQAFDVTTTTRSRLFRSNSVEKFKDAITDGTTRIIQQGFTESSNDINRAARHLGIDTSNALDDFKFTLESESLNVAEFISAASDEYARVVFSSIEKYTKAGESLNDAIIRIGEDIANIDVGLFLGTGLNLKESYGEVIKESAFQLEVGYELARQSLREQIDANKAEVEAIRNDRSGVDNPSRVIRDLNKEIKEGWEEYKKLGEMMQDTDTEALVNFSQSLQNAISQITGVDVDNAAAMFNRISSEWTKALEGDEVLAERRLELARKELERVSAATGIMVNSEMTIEQADAAIQAYLDSVMQSADGTSDLAAMMGQAEGNVASLKSAFLEATGAMDNLSESLRNLVQSAMQGVQDAIARQRRELTDSYNAEVQIINNRTNNLRSQLSIIQEQSRALGDLRRVARALTDTANRLNMNDPVSRGVRREQSQAFVGNALTVARAGGGFPDIDMLQPHLRAISEPSEDLFGSFEDYARDFLKTKRDIQELADLANDQLTTEEQMLSLQQTFVRNQIGHNDDLLFRMRMEHEEELALLDDQLKEAEKIYNAALGINTSVLSVADAIQALRDAILQMNNSQQSQVIVVQPEPEDFSSYTNSNEVLDFSEYASLYGPPHPGSSAIQQLRPVGKKVPMFASGGIHSGGLRIVGEEGPELEWTPPSKIYSNPKTKDMLDNSEMVEELKRLREEVNMLRYETRAVASNTGKTARIMDDVTQGGTTIRTEEVVE